MPGFVGRVLPVAVVLLPILALVACAPADPVERVAAARGAYEVQLSGWIVRSPEPPAEDAMAESGEVAAEAAVAAEEAGTEEGGEEEMMEEMGPDPREVGILFDLLVLFSGRDALPGLTIEISHADAQGSEKAARQHYLELPGTVRGSTQQVDFELDGWDFEDGDQFHVEIRSVVPPEERGAYREFAEAG